MIRNNTALVRLFVFLLLFSTSCLLIITDAAVLEDRRSVISSAKLASNDGVEIDPEKVFYLPKFENVVEGKEIIPSSTCGQLKKSRYCFRPSYHSDFLRCEICDKNDKNKYHAVDYLIDLDMPSNKTCWISESLEEKNNNINNNNNFDHESIINTNKIKDGMGGGNVSLHIKLNKAYELTYISLQFCYLLPDSFAIYKSMDFGRHWTPFQFYSSDCQVVYGVEPNRSITRDNEQEALCTQLYNKLDSKSNNHINSNNNNNYHREVQSQTIAFSTLENRPNSFNLDNSPVLQDWVTATDIRIEFNRFQSDQQPYYAVSDLSIGGRCKCNGHADICLLTNNNNNNKNINDILKPSPPHTYQKCLCKHNTEGRDCERCKPLYRDRPWARANKQTSNACVKCKCNNHSQFCRFNKELYEWSGYVSGGICQDCQHNTAGRFCHYCREKFYRDQKVEISNVNACKACHCHHYGAKGKVCDSINGQCSCKVGVVGRSCNRCAPNYQQTKSKIVPCQRRRRGNNNNYNDENNGNVERHPISKQKCMKCLKRSRKATAKKYCKRDYALRIQVRDTSSSSSGKMRINSETYQAHQIRIKMIYKLPQQTRRHTHTGGGGGGGGHHYDNNHHAAATSMLLKNSYVNVLIKAESALSRKKKKYSSSSSSSSSSSAKTSLLCICPYLKANNDYLVMADFRTVEFKGKRFLWFNKRTVVVDWINNNEMQRKIKRFESRQRYRRRC